MWRDSPACYVQNLYSVVCPPHKAASTMYISLVALLGAQSSCIIKRPRAYFLREPAGGRTQMLPGLSETEPREPGSLRIRASPCAREGGGNGWQRHARVADWMEEACCSGWLRLRQSAGGLVQFSASPQRRSTDHHCGGMEHRWGRPTGAWGSGLQPATRGQQPT